VPTTVAQARVADAWIDRVAHYCTAGPCTFAAASVRDVHGIDLTRAVSSKVDTAQTNRENIRG
jgi:hypothetical protein